MEYIILTILAVVTFVLLVVPAIGLTIDEASDAYTKLGKFFIWLTGLSWVVFCLFFVVALVVTITSPSSSHDNSQSTHTVTPVFIHNFTGKK